jgi:hypothetical protein
MSNYFFKSCTFDIIPGISSLAPEDVAWSFGSFCRVLEIKRSHCFFHFKAKDLFDKKSYYKIYNPNHSEIRSYELPEITFSIDSSDVRIVFRKESGETWAEVNLEIIKKE